MDNLAVDIRDIWLSYNGTRFALQGISLGVEQGRICMILGASGSGKTTLLKVIKGLLKPQRGTVCVLGQEQPQPLDTKRCLYSLSSVAYIPQNLGLVRNLTVLENVLTGALSQMGTLPSLIKAFPRKYLEKAKQLLDLLGIGHKVDDKVYSLSGGERQRVAIARALMQDPKLILADEFVSQLDPMRTLEIMDIMRGIAQRGVTLVITSHEPELVAQYGHKAVVLRDGLKVHEGPAREFNLESLKGVMR